MFSFESWKASCGWTYQPRAFISSITWKTLTSSDVKATRFMSGRPSRRRPGDAPDTVGDAPRRVEHLARDLEVALVAEEVEDGPRRRERPDRTWRSARSG